MTTPADRTRANASARLERSDLFCRPPEEIDQASVDPFAGYLMHMDPNTNVFVDMTGVTFCNSAALNLFVAARARFVEGGGSLRVRKGSAMFLRLIDIGGLKDLLAA